MNGTINTDKSLMPDKIDAKTFSRFTDFIYEKAGIKLGDHKEALLSARLAKRMRKLGLADFASYYQHVEQDPTGEELVELLNVISTNVTRFYREKDHFDFLSDKISEWEASGQRRFRIWCAASSTGEEPYTLALTLKESLNDPGDSKILATDISTRVLGIASRGEYGPDRVEGISRGLLFKYFKRVRTGGGNVFKVSPSLREMITFGRINLSKPPFRLKGPLDFIFCRNVMIYFDGAVKRRLIAEFERLLKPGGYLVVGHAESLMGMLGELESVKPSVYVKPECGTGAKP